jgi:outer membrane protein assembly factor BamB
MTRAFARTIDDLVRAVLIGFTLLILAAGSARRASRIQILYRITEATSARAGGGRRRHRRAPTARVADEDGAGVVRLRERSGDPARVPRPATNRGRGLRIGAGGERRLLYAGAPGDRAAGAVYALDTAAGAVIRTVRAPDMQALGFGRALAVVGDTLLVGAPDSVVQGRGGAGAVFVFSASGVPIRTLRAVPPSTNAFFGSSVATVGDVVAVGAPGAAAGGVEGAGAVHLFDATTGALVRTLRAPIPVARGAFGAVVAALDGMLVVGAPGGDGGAYVFDAATGELRQIVRPPSVAGVSGFGGALAVVNGDLLVGADDSTLDGRARAGRAFLLDGATRALRATLQAHDPRAGGRFGFALAAAGATAVIGEPIVGTAAYLFGPSDLPGDAGGPAAAVSPRPPSGGLKRIDLLRVRILLTTVTADACRSWHARCGVHCVSWPGPGVRGARRTRALQRAGRALGKFVRRVQARGTPPAWCGPSTRPVRLVPTPACSSRQRTRSSGRVSRAALRHEVVGADVAARPGRPGVGRRAFLRDQTSSLKARTAFSRRNFRRTVSGSAQCSASWSRGRPTGRSGQSDAKRHLSWPKVRRKCVKADGKCFGTCADVSSHTFRCFQATAIASSLHGQPMWPPTMRSSGKSSAT